MQSRYKYSTQALTEAEKTGCVLIYLSEVYENTIKVVQRLQVQTEPTCFSNALHQTVISCLDLKN